MYAGGHSDRSCLEVLFPMGVVTYVFVLYGSLRAKSTTPLFSGCDLCLTRLSLTRVRGAEGSDHGAASLEIRYQMTVRCFKWGKGWSQKNRCADSTYLLR